MIRVQMFSFLSALCFLTNPMSLGAFDALRNEPERFTGIVKVPVPGFYTLRLFGKNGTENLKFEQELFCTSFQIDREHFERMLWIPDEKNFSEITLYGGKRKSAWFRPPFLNRNSFALRITPEYDAEFFLQGRSLGVFPAGKPWLIRIPWWEMSSSGAEIAVEQKTDGKLKVETTRLHGIRFFRKKPDSPANRDWPKISLGKSIVLALFDPEKGFYRGCRFLSAGMIAAGPGFSKNYEDGFRDPRNHDDAAGQAEEFIDVPDYDSPHEVFMKIGVGLLKKDANPYFQQKNYEIVSFFPWKTKIFGNTAEFYQEGKSPAGYAYSLNRKISLNDCVLRLDYTLKNTGIKKIETREYAHNFLEPSPVHFPDGSFFRKKITEYHTLPGGSDDGRAETPHLILHESGPLLSRAVFLTRRASSPEFFRRISIAPGETLQWNRTYILRGNTEKIRKQKHEKTHKKTGEE